MAAIPIFHLQTLLQVADDSLSQHCFAERVELRFRAQGVNQNLETFQEVVLAEVIEIRLGPGGVE